MSKHNIGRRRSALVLVAALALAVPQVGAAWPLFGVGDRAAAAGGAIAWGGVMDWLAVVFGGGGNQLGAARTGANAMRNSFAKEGMGIDPNGVTNPQHGMGIDPDGGTHSAIPASPARPAGTSDNSDHGMGIDPNG